MHVTDGREGREAAFVKMTGEEIRMTMLLRIMWATMDGKGAKTLEKRLRSIPRGWMRFRQAMGLLERMFDTLVPTINDRQLAQINNTIKNGEVTVKLKRAGAYDDDMNVVRADALAVAVGTAMRADALAVAVGTAMRAECMLCVKERADIKRCPLRKAIDELCPPESYETHTCVYRDLALDHVFPDTDPSKI